MSTLIRVGNFEKRSAFPDIDRWVVHTLRELYTIDDSAPEYIRERIPQLLTPQWYNQSCLTNVYRLTKYKRQVFVDAVNYICTVFHATRGEIRANYCLLFSADTKSLLSIWNNPEARRRIKRKVEAVYYSASPSLRSADGEYRSRIYDDGKLAMLQREYSDIWDYLEEYVLDKIQRNGITLGYEHYNPRQELFEHGSDLAEIITTKRLMINTFIHFWLIELYNINIGLQENHINPRYNVVVFNDMDQDRKFMKRLYQTFGNERVTNMIFLLSIYPEKSADKLIPQPWSIGQKLIPMNVADVQNPFDIGYRTWREIYVNDRVADLVANFVCTSFPVMIDWLYLKSSKTGLFDNDEQQQRIEVSERARIIIAKLRETQRLTQNEQRGDILPAIGSELDAPIDRIESRLLISNVTMGVLAENVGRTLWDVPLLEKGSRVWVSKVGSLLHNTTTFQKYMFDLCYAIACMNIKLGVTHSDLHLNNMAININSLYTPPSGSRAVYGVGGRWYSFPCNGHYAYLIDYSRSTVHPEYTADYRAENKAYMNTADFEAFRDAQNDRMVNTLKGQFPNFYSTHKVELERVMANHYDKFYRLYTMVDVWSFSNKLHGHYGSNGCSRVNLELLDRIRRSAEYYLTTGMNKFFINPEVEVEWPILELIQECFSQNLSTPDDGDTICDVWSIDRPMNYSTRRYELWPPYLKQVCEMKSNTSTPKAVPAFRNQIQIRKDFERYRLSQMSMIRKIAQRHELKYQ